MVVCRAGDTIALGLILNKNEKAYFEEIKSQKNWCQENN